MDTPATPALPWRKEIEQWVKSRLQQGELLITTAQFQHACEAEYQRRTGSAASENLKAQFREKIEAFSAAQRQDYVTQGVQNGIIRGFRAGVIRLGWKPPQIKRRGPETVSQFLRRARIRTLCKAVGICRGHIDPADCVDMVLDSLPPEAEAEEEQPSIITLSAQAAEAWRHRRSDSTLLNDRLLEQERQLVALERGRSEPFGLQGDQGQATPEKGKARIESKQTKGRRLYRATPNASEQDLRDDSPQSEGGSTIVCYQQVFMALGKIAAKYDGALRFLLRHKDAVMATERAAMQQALGRLAADLPLAGQILEMMVADLEMRMVYWRLPPYHLGIIPPRGEETEITTEESFVDELRQLSPEALGQKLQAGEAETCKRTATDIRGVVALLEHLLYPCCWRQELQLLKIQFTLKKVFLSGTSLKEARKQAQTLFSFGLSRLLPDLAPEERRVLQEQRATLINFAEEQAQNPAAKGKSDAKEGGVSLSLTPAEIEKGAQLGYVETRVAGTYQKRLYPLLPDPDNDGQYILSQRTRPQGGLVPILQRGVKCRVRQRQNGLWRRAR